jgi:hypothetical protein
MKNVKQWEADGFEIVVAGVAYFVNANFNWETDSVDYRFDPSRGYSGQGQDLIAEVPACVEEIEIFGAEETDAVPVSVRAELSARILEEFASSERGTRSPRWGRWM